MMRVLIAGCQAFNRPSWFRMPTLQCAKKLKEAPEVTLDKTQART
jgi:hypothetical protein